MGATEPNILHPKKYMDLILCTQKNTRLDILDPEKNMTFIRLEIRQSRYMQIILIMLLDLAGALA